MNDAEIGYLTPPSPGDASYHRLDVRGSPTVDPVKQPSAQVVGTDANSLLAQARPALARQARRAYQTAVDGGECVQCPAPRWMDQAAENSTVASGGMVLAAVCSCRHRLRQFPQPRGGLIFRTGRIDRDR